jgi:hypothetical protein
MRRAALLGLAVAMLSPLPAHAFDAAPHRALYTIALDSAKPSSGVLGAEGTLAYQWGDTCEGWTVEQRYDLTLQYEGEQPVEMVSSFVTYESKDGRSYRFDLRKTRNGQPDEELRGEARLDAPGGPGKATFSKPREQSFELPAGAYFPTAHTLMLIAKAEAGESFVPAQLFDGSALEGAALASAVISRTLSKGSVKSGVASPLLDRPSWRMRLAFFPASPKAEQPEYELGMRLLDDGVSDEMAIDNGDYVIRAQLQEIQALPKPAC